MRALLLFPDRDAELKPQPPEGAEDLIADLDLQPVLDAMVTDRRLLKNSPNLLLCPLTEPTEIRWRQHVLADALADPVSMRGLFELAGRALESQHVLWMHSGRTADSSRGKSVLGLKALLPYLRELQAFAAQRLSGPRSPGLSQLYRRLSEELEPAYLDHVAVLLEQLEFPSGVVSRARLTDASLIGSLELLAPRHARRGWRAALGLTPTGHHRFTLAERDEAGAKALGELRDDAIHDLAVTLARANSHVLGFFRQLRWETGFYVGGIQLYECLQGAGVGVCWPDPEPAGTALSATKLMSLSLIVRSGEAATPNDLAGPDVPLAIVTGANQGGKTTFLRSIGCAQLLLQAGMFVPAASYRASLAANIHTHFRRAEDDDLLSGKLDEELTRMSGIVDRCTPADLLLMNESFASTDELEGSYIASDLIDALLSHGVRILVVTHFRTLAQSYLDRPGATFLMAERLPDGSRSHRVLPGTPLATSHGVDIYHQVFGPTRRRTNSGTQHQYQQPTRCPATRRTRELKE